MRPATLDYDARWGYRQFDARRYERRRYGGAIRRLNHRLLERALGRALAGLAPGAVVLDAPCGTGILAPFLARRGLLVATVCHPYTLKSFGRALRRALGRRAKQSPRLTRRALAAELDAAGLELERVIPVMPLLSEVWVVVVRKPGSS